MDKNLELALQALKDGIIIKRYPNEGGYNEFYGNELYIIFYQNEYQLGVMRHQGYLAVKDYGKVWILKPQEHDSNIDQDILFKDLFEENFGA